MKYFYLWISMIICFPSFSQTNINIDSIYEERLENIEKVTKANINVVHSIRKQKDSLERELLYYRVKEDYFAAALGEQATRFGVIIGSIVGLLALLSFSWYRIEKREINKKFKSFTDQFNQLKKENEELEDNLNILTANAGVMFADEFHKIKSYDHAFLTNLSTATSLLNVKGKMKEKTNDAIIMALDRCFKDLSEMKKASGPIEELNIWKNGLYEDLDEINRKGTEEMKNYVAKIRLLLTSILQKS